MKEVKYQIDTIDDKTINTPPLAPKTSILSLYPHL